MAKLLYQNNVMYITVLFAFSKSQRYKRLSKITLKTISHGNFRKSRMSKFREIVQTQVKFHHQFHFTSTFKCST